MPVPPTPRPFHVPWPGAESPDSRGSEPSLLTALTLMLDLTLAFPPLLVPVSRDHLLIKLPAPSPHLRLGFWENPN